MVHTRKVVGVVVAALALAGCTDAMPFDAVKSPRIVCVNEVKQHLTYPEDTKIPDPIVEQKDSTHFEVRGTAYTRHPEEALTPLNFQCTVTRTSEYGMTVHLDSLDLPRR